MKNTGINPWEASKSPKLHGQNNKKKPVG